MTTLKLNYAGKEGVLSFKDKNDTRHYYLIINITELPMGISFAVNPRTPNTKKPVAKEIRKSLEAGDGKFLQKNLGITILAKDVEIDKENHLAQINLGAGAISEKGGPQNPYGIANGGHTYQVIMEARNDAEGSPGENYLQDQFVSVRVIVDNKPDKAFELAKSLNTSLNVDPESIANIQGNFKWIKDALDGDIKKKINWHQGGDGVLSVAELFNVLLCMHPEKFRVSENPYIDDHPNQTYASKAAARKEYDQKQTDKPEKSLKKMAPIANDILELRDYIQYKAFDLLTPKLKKDKPSIRLVDSAKSGMKFVSPKYMNEEPEKILNKAAIHPILASYRCLIKLGKEYHWNVRGGLEGVKSLYVDHCLEMQIKTLVEIIEKNHKDASPTKWGKDEYIWSSCYRIVGQEFKKKG